MSLTREETFKISNKVSNLILTVTQYHISFIHSFAIFFFCYSLKLGARS